MRRHDVWTMLGQGQEGEFQEEDAHETSFPICLESKGSAQAF